jgi:quinohemoprotein ethanol dehydrogenase
MRARKLAVWGLFALTAVGQGPRRVDDAALRNASKSGDEWISYGITPGETRYSPLNQINATNVSRLGLAWSAEIGTGGGNQEATPLVWNGTIYGITNWSIVFAVDARTGKEKWRWDPEVNRTAVQPKVCCGIVNRGLALYNGKIIAPVIDGRLVGLDAESGKPLWESRVAYTQDGYSITMAPRIAKGKVIIGVSGAEYPVRGFFAGYDADTGKFAWRFYTVPGDPSKGFENEAMRRAAETWEGEWWKVGGGGGTVWDGIAYDPDANLLYVGTGNAGPWPEELRKQSKGKDNLYACSIVAVNPDNGEYKWHFQMVPGDEWDFDSVQQLMLADVTIKGQSRKVLMQANKNGFYYVLDRITGKFIQAAPFAKVTWAKGLDEATGRPIVNAESYYGKDAVAITPGPGGAHNWAPMSFNPATGLVYLPNSSGGNFNFSVAPDFTFRPGQMNMGIAFGGFGGGPGRGGPGGRGPAPAAGNTGAAPEVATAAAQAAARGPAPAPVPPTPAKPAITPPAIGPVEQDQQGGSLVAWDPVGNKQRWRVPDGNGGGGGTVSTAGNLVFQMLSDGRLRAYSADKGEKLMEIQTGLRSGTGPPITYQLDGKQYVAVMGGQGTVSFGGFGGPPPPPAPGATPPPPPPAPKLMVFVLDGKAPLPAAAN